MASNTSHEEIIDLTLTTANIETCQVEKISSGIEIIDLTDDGPQEAQQPIFPQTKSLRLFTQHLRASNAAVIQSLKLRAQTRRRYKPRRVKPGSQLSRRKTPLTEFTIFPDLPPEIRLKVWKFAILQPQTHQISIEWLANWESGNISNPARNPITFTPLPSMFISGHRATLQACKESRDESKELLENTLKIRGATLPKVLYFNAEIDTISMDAASVFAMTLCSGKFPCDAFVHRKVLGMLHFDDSVFYGFDSIRKMSVDGMAHHSYRLNVGLDVLVP